MDKYPPEKEHQDHIRQVLKKSTLSKHQMETFKRVHFPRLEFIMTFTFPKRHIINTRKLYYIKPMPLSRNVEGRF